MHVWEGSRKVMVDMTDSDNHFRFVLGGGREEDRRLGAG